MTGDLFSLYAEFIRGHGSVILISLCLVAIPILCGAAVAGMSRLNKIVAAFGELQRKSVRTNEILAQELERLGKVEGLLRIQNEDTEAVGEKIDDLQSVLRGLTKQAETYRALLVNIRDFYAALAHFREGTEKLTDFVAEVEITLGKFKESVDSSGQAALEFNQMAAQVKRQQDRMIAEIGRMYQTLENQNNNLSRILGQVDLAVKVEASDHVDRNLAETLEHMRSLAEEQARLVENLQPALARLGKGAFWQIFGR